MLIKALRLGYGLSWETGPSRLMGATTPWYRQKFAKPCGYQVRRISWFPWGSVGAEAVRVASSNTASARPPG